MEDADLARNEKVLEQEIGISELNDDDAFLKNWASKFKLVSILLF
jgi:hypothetical protein